MKPAFLFAGQGQQFYGMGRDLAAEFSEAAEVYETARERLGYDILHLDEESLGKTAYTQPALFTLNHSLFRIFEKRGVLPSVVAGLSLGEYNALVAAGVLPFSGTVRLIARRGEIMSDALEPGTTGMAAVLKADIQTVKDVISLPEYKDKIDICNVNTHEQIVIGGVSDALAPAAEELRARGVRKIVPLAVSVASHMSLLRPAGELLRAELEKCSFRNPNCLFINNIGAELQESGFVDTLARQISESTHMNETILHMLEMGVDTFVELGPRGSLCGFVRAIAKKEEREAQIFNVYDVPSVWETLERIAD